nr:unnamed protein product [Spirometra erinaceieuropaei]
MAEQKPVGGGGDTTECGTVSSIQWQVLKLESGNVLVTGRAKTALLGIPLSKIDPGSQHNISSKQLTPIQLKVLSHEACFNTDPVNLMATVESILKQTREPDEATHLIRQQVTSLLMAHKSRAIITKAEQNALKALRNDTSIVIIPADKGRSTVVLDKTDYVQKANALLEDRQAYLPCGE